MNKESGKNQHAYFACMTVFFFLLASVMLSSPLRAADLDTAKAAIAAGVAAGTDVSVIMKDAIAAGMTTEQAADALVTAGADPGRVVYEAITAKYADEAVIKGVAGAVFRQHCTDSTLTSPCAGQASAIISAGLQAGLTVPQINGWLAAAGFPPTVVASANTQVFQSPGPAEGYTAPTSGAPLTSIIGGGGGPIGGSSIGSPTKPASPTKP